MTLNKLFCSIIIGLILLLNFSDLSTAAKAKAKAAKSKRAYSVSARSAIFSNSTQGERYYGKNINTKVIPASTTKVMTALLVLEKLPLDQVITVSRRAVGAPPSNIHLKAGEKFKVRDLLYAILLNSANDAAIVLAEAVAGSEWKFVAMMNDRAKQLGAKNTKFANASGLPTKKVRQYTTAYDMYLIFRQALKHGFFKNAVADKHRTISSLGGRKVNLRNHNKMLFKGWKKNIYGKTGYTRAAKACFVGYFMKEKEVHIIAVFGCTRRWDDIKHIISRYSSIVL